jgi:hypothetical protein
MKNDREPAGGIRARRIHAENVVEGVQFQGVDRDTAAQLISLARGIQSNGIDADEVITRNLVTGLQYIDKAGQSSIDELRNELNAIHVKLAEAISEGDIPEHDATYADEALTEAEMELAQPRPNRGSIVRKLGDVAEIVTKTAEASAATQKLTSQAIGLAPLVATVYQVAQRLLGT